MKKVLIQNNEQLELVREEIRVSSLFSHRNLLPLLDHAMIAVKVVISKYFHLTRKISASSQLYKIKFSIGALTKLVLNMLPMDFSLHSS